MKISMDVGGAVMTQETETAIEIGHTEIDQNQAHHTTTEKQKMRKNKTLDR